MDLKLFSERIRGLRGSKSQREVAGAIGTTQHKADAEAKRKAE